MPQRSDDSVKVEVKKHIAAPILENRTNELLRNADVSKRIEKHPGGNNRFVTKDYLDLPARRLAVGKAGFLF